MLWFGVLTIRGALDEDGMRFNRLLICLIPLGFIVSSCGSSSLSPTTTVAEPPQIVDGYNIKPGADLSWAKMREINLADANLRGANLTRVNAAGGDLGSLVYTNTDGAILPW